MFRKGTASLPLEGSSAKMAGEKQRPSHFDAYKTERNIMYFFGFPLGRNEYTPLMFIKATVVLFLSFCLIVSMVVKIMVEIDNIPVILEILYFGLTQTTFLCKIVNFLLHKEKYYALEDFLRKPIFNIHTVEQDVHVKEAVVITSGFAKVFRYMVMTTITFYAIFPFIENTLPLPGWFPFDEKKYHFVLYVYHLMALIFNGFIHSSLDCCSAGLIRLASAQFKILMDNLRNIRRPEEAQLTVEEVDEIIRRRVKKCVNHHNEIIEFVNQIEGMYSYVILVQYLCSIIIICVTGFQIFVMPPSRIQYITLVLYFGCNLTQISILSWFGHDIMTTSGEIGGACYAGEWNEYSPKTRKLIFIVMERSKRPVTLTAGKFINLTLSTLMTILRTSYSYFAVLQHMYK